MPPQQAARLVHTAAMTARRLADNADPALKPKSNPEEDGADDNVGDVMGTVVELLGAVTAPLSKHVGVGERSASGGDMYRCSTGKVEAAHAEHPTRRIPCPAGNGVVNNGCPDEHVDDAGKHPSSFSNGSNGKCDSDGCEHALVDGKHQIGDAGTSNGWSTEHVHVTKVIECANVLSSLVRKGERIAPEEPLEADNRRRHDGKP